ncbi:hypothetical protein D1871_08935 [Nakamurella silvestris]|nr:hypothetical protein D1871_08935 [Nakamurella silvestris]
MPAADAAVTCSLCGQGTGTDPLTGSPADPPVTWVYEFQPRRGGVWLCENCARLHLRSIEAGLHRDDW